MSAKEIYKNNSGRKIGYFSTHKNEIINNLFGNMTPKLVIQKIQLHAGVYKMYLKNEIDFR